MPEHNPNTEMKKMNLLILPLVLAAGCSQADDADSLKPRPVSPATVVYSDAVEVPVIHTIDETTGYTVYYIDKTSLLDFAFPMQSMMAEGRDEEGE